MRILIIEDGLSKLQVISNALSKYELETVKSVNTAKSIMRRSKFDLLIIDMTLPTFEMDSGEAGRIQHDGGINLIQYAKTHQSGAKCVLFTQYDMLDIDGKSTSLDDISESLLRKYPKIYVGSVLYQSESDKWLPSMLKFVEDLHENIDCR